MNTRLVKLREALLQKDLEAVVIFSRENRRYFADFAGSSGALIITGSEALLLTDFRYYAEAQTKSSNYFEVIQHPGGQLTDSVGEQLKKLELKNVGVEEDRKSVV